MDAQLRLLRMDPPPTARRKGRDDWRLDDETIEAGRRGVAMARAAMRRSRDHAHDGGDEPRGDRHRSRGTVRGHAA